jgi:serine/threonine protein kinase
MVLVTEYCEGGNLEAAIHKAQEVPRKTSWYVHGMYIALGVARGLMYLHARNIIWFDCKPSNVLLELDGVRAKIADVGQSKLLAGSKTETCAVRPLRTT